MVSWVSNAKPYVIPLPCIHTLLSIHRALTMSLDHLMCITMILWLSPSLPPCSMWCLLNLAYITLSIKVSKLGFINYQNQTRAFNLPLFGNWWQPLTKIRIQINFELKLLAQTFLSCFKNWTITLSSVLVVLAPPTYVLHVFGTICSHMHRFWIVGE